MAWSALIPGVAFTMLRLKPQQKGDKHAQDERRQDDPGKRSFIYGHFCFQAVFARSCLNP